MERFQSENICPVCGRKRHASKIREDEDGVITKYNSCKHCGITWQDHFEYAYSDYDETQSFFAISFQYASQDDPRKLKDQKTFHSREEANDEWDNAVARYTSGESDLAISRVFVRRRGAAGRYLNETVFCARYERHGKSPHVTSTTVLNFCEMDFDKMMDKVMSRKSTVPSL